GRGGWNMRSGDQDHPVPTAGQEPRHLAALQLLGRHPQHVPGIPGPDHRGHCHPVLPRHGRPGPLHPDHDGGGDRSQQVGRGTASSHHASPPSWGW
uniref:Uncharacterized protein n=1 Tax=Piliocolobus tephrosceles TaxID=591936 RepID=A0A8C9H3P3_9PRIM